MNPANRQSEPEILVARDAEDDLLALEIQGTFADKDCQVEAVENPVLARRFSISEKYFPLTASIDVDCDFEDLQGIEDEINASLAEKSSEIPDFEGKEPILFLEELTFFPGGNRDPE